MSTQTGRFDIFINPAQRTGYIRHQGKISLDNLNTSASRMIYSSRFESVERGMSDFRKSWGTLSTDDLRSHVMFIVRHVPRNRPIKWAILAQTSLAYGLARMFEILTGTEVPNLDIQVFRDPREARLWLGLEEIRRVS